MARGYGRSLAATGDPELTQDLRHMPLNGAGTEEQALGDFPIAQALAQQSQDLSLAGREVDVLHDDSFSNLHLESRRRSHIETGVKGAPDRLSDRYGTTAVP